MKSRIESLKKTHTQLNASSSIDYRIIAPEVQKLQISRLNYKRGPILNETWLALVN